MIAQGKLNLRGRVERQGEAEKTLDASVNSFGIRLPFGPGVGLELRYAEQCRILTTQP